MTMTIQGSAMLLESVDWIAPGNLTQTQAQAQALALALALALFRQRKGAANKMV